jgi:hypothetical protein
LSHENASKSGEYKVYASNLKLSHRPGRKLGSVSLFIPSFGLHLFCSWERDERGRERVGMPRTLVTTPDGRVHRKSLARWATAAAEARFQRSALGAIHEYLARTATSGDHLTAPPRARPNPEPTRGLAISASPSSTNR